MNIRLIDSVVKELFYSFDHGDEVGRELIRKRVLQRGFVGRPAYRRGFDIYTCFEF